MEREKLIQSLDASNKETINLYTTFLEISSRKRLFHKKRQYKYTEIEKICLNISDEISYVKTLGNFATLSFTIRKKGMIGFDFFEYDVRELKFSTSRIVAFVGSTQACIQANETGGNDIFSDKVEIIEPEVIGYAPELSYKKMFEDQKPKMLDAKLEKSKENEQKLLE